MALNRPLTAEERAAFTPTLSPRPSITAVEREQISGDVLGVLRAYVENRMGERSRNVQRGVAYDVLLALFDAETPVVEALGHLRDAERYPPGSEGRADCIQDAAAAMIRAAREHGRDV